MVKNLPANAEDGGLILGLERSPWRRKWQPTPVFLPGKCNGQRGLVGYIPWGHKQSDTTEWLSACARTHTHTHTDVHFLIPGICNHVTLLGKQAYQLSLNEDSWVGEIILDNLGGFTIITSVLISEQLKVRGDVMRKAEVRQMTRRGYELWMQVLPETMKSKAIASLLESPEGRPPQQSILDISPLEW